MSVLTNITTNTSKHEPLILPNNIFRCLLMYYKRKDLTLDNNK